MDAPPVQYARTEDGVSIAYSVMGSGPPLVLLPDIPIAIDKQWEIPELRAWFGGLATGSTVVTFDPPGVGLSDRDAPDTSFQTGGGSLEAVVDALQLERFDLMGAYRRTPYAIRYAATQPERVGRLILWSPYGEGAAVQQTRGHDAVAKLLQTDWRTYTEIVLRVSTGLPGDRVTVIAELARDSISREVYVQQAVAQREADVRELTERISAPTLILHRPDSTMVSMDFVREIAAHVPGSTLRTFTGDSVYPYFGEASPILDAIGAFLGRTTSERPAGSERAALPGAVQTILFTDLAGSTAMQSRLGDDAARDILRAHDVAVRRAIEEFHGREVKHTGDGMMASFGSAADAVNCALQVRRDIATYNDTHEGEELRVRFGLNAGEPIAEDDDLFGLSVTLAARIGDWGEPGQVLCSNVVRELLLGKQFEFTSMGDATLKGFDEPVALYEVRVR